MFDKIKANVIVGRMLEDFNELKKTYPGGDSQRIYFGLLFTLRLQEPFKSFTGDDAAYVVERLEKFDNLEKGVKFLCLITYKVVSSKIKDKNIVKKLFQSMLKH